MAVKTAFLFPGQGAQEAGMGRDIAAASPAAASVFEQANEILDWDVAHLCFEGPQEELDRTATCQPVVLTTSIAILAAMEEAGMAQVSDCTAAAGLSLGEYSALVMAKALEFADALHLVHKRGQFMAAACTENPGTMVSVLGLEDGIVEAICAQAREDGMVVAANYNCPGQVVISGSREGIERASELAREKGARRVIPLAVGGAFHSPLMAPAAERLEEALEATGIAPCSITVIANVTAEPVYEPEEIRCALANQVRSPVLWTQSIQHLVGEGYTHFVEVGPGKVLTALMRRIAPECTVENISAAEALRGET